MARLLLVRLALIPTVPAHKAKVLPYCRNFRKGYTYFPEIFLEILHVLEIDPQKPSNVTCDANCDGQYLYDGFYHFVGTIIKTRSTPRNEYDRIELPSNTEIIITQNHMLASRNFTDPVGQIDFFTYVPWLLDEPEPEDT